MSTYDLGDVRLLTAQWLLVTCERDDDTKLMLARGMIDYLDSYNEFDTIYPKCRLKMNKILGNTCKCPGKKSTFPLCSE